MSSMSNELTLETPDKTETYNSQYVFERRDKQDSRGIRGESLGVDTTYTYNPVRDISDAILNYVSQPTVGKVDEVSDIAIAYGTFERSLVLAFGSIALLATLLLIISQTYLFANLFFLVGSAFLLGSLAIPLFAVISRRSL